MKHKEIFESLKSELLHLDTMFDCSPLSDLLERDRFYETVLVIYKCHCGCSAFCFTYNVIL